MSKTKEWFDPSKSFFDLPIVWRTIGFIGGLFVLITGSIIYNGNYSPNGSAAGFNLFVKDFSFPLGVLSLLIPIIAVYAAQHRSNLMIKQIEETESQNRFANYYKHKEEFEIMCEKIIKAEYQSTFELKNSSKLYNLFFPKNSTNSLSFAINGLLIRRAVETNQSIQIQTLNRLVRYVTDSNSHEYDLIVNAVQSFFQHFGVLINFDLLKNLSVYNDSILIEQISTTFIDLITSLTSFSTHIDDVDAIEQFEIENLLNITNGANDNDYLFGAIEDAICKALGNDLPE